MEKDLFLKLYKQGVFMEKDLFLKLYKQGVFNYDYLYDFQKELLKMKKNLKVGVKNEKNI